MRRLAALALIAVAASGCIGSSGGGSASIPSHGPIQAKTSAVFSYPVGVSQRRRSGVARCPEQATCSVVRVAHVTPTSWIRVARRQIFCDTAAGYQAQASSNATCGALMTLVEYLRSPPDEVCSCPAVLEPPFRIDGFIERQLVALRFDSCRLCGSGAKVSTALQHLITST